MRLISRFFALISINMFIDFHVLTYKKYFASSITLYVLNQ